MPQLNRNIDSFSYFESAKAIISVLQERLQWDGIFQLVVSLFSYHLSYSYFKLLFYCTKGNFLIVQSKGPMGLQKPTEDTEFFLLASVHIRAWPQMIQYIYIIHTMLKKNVKNNHWCINVYLYPDLDGFQYAGYTCISLLLSAHVRLALEMKNSVTCML